MYQSMLVRSSRSALVSFSAIFALALAGGGLLIAPSMALAAHTATVTVSPTLVKGNQSSTYTFNITNNGADAIYKVIVAIPSGFTSIASASCPAGMTASEVSSTQVICLGDTFEPGTQIASSASAQVSFSATSPTPGSDTSYTWTVTTRDTTGASVPNTSAQTNVDATAPTISAAVEQDTNGDGKIDKVSVTFSEFIKDSTVTVGQFALAGTPSFDGFSTGTADDNMGDFTISAGIEGTEKKEFTYTAGSLTDLAGNLMTSKDAAAISEQDSAAPVMVSAQTKTTTRIDTTWSENIDGTTVNDSGTEFTVVGFAVSVADDNSDNIVELTVATMPTGATPGVTFTNIGTFKDLNGNEAITPTTVTAADGITPTFTAVRTGLNTIVLTFSENVDVTTVDGSGYTLSAGTVTANTDPAGASNTITLTTSGLTGTSETPTVTYGTTAGTTADVAANEVTDGASAVASDAVAPTVSITSSASPGPTNDSPIPMTVTFSETVTGFDVGDITVGNGIKADFIAVSGTVYTFNVTSPGEGAVIVDIAGAVTKDTANNDNTAAAQFSITYDSVPPSVTSIILTDPALKVDETSLVTITFNEAVTGFTNADITTIEGGSLTTVASSDNITWTATFTPTADITDATNLITITKTGIADLAGNVGVGAASSDNYAIDTVRPTVEVTMGAATFKVGDTTTVTFTFSEAPAGFTTADVTVGSGTIGTIDTANPLVQTATFTPTADTEDTVNIITVSTAWTDPAGNAPLAGDDSPNYTIDTKKPSVVLASVTANPTNELIAVTAEFSESVTGFDATDVTITNGVVGNFAAVDGNSYTFDVNPTDGASVAVTIDVLANKAIDAATNSNTASNQLTYTSDTVAPTVILTQNHSGLTIHDADTVVVTATFNEAMTSAPTVSINAVTNDVTAVAMTPTGDPKVWTYSWDVPTDNDGAAVATVAGTDLAGNAYAGATNLAFTIDNIAPTVVVTSSQEGGVVVGNLTIDTSGVSGVNVCTYKFDSEAEQAVACNATGISIASLEGNHTLTFYGRDNAGNEGFDVISFIANNDQKLTVGASGADFTSIQTAINNATDGDTIEVATGTYTENVNVNKILTLTGIGNPTVNPFTSGNSVFNVTASSTISGFTVSGATGAGQAGIYIGAGMVGSYIHDNILTSNYDGIWLGSGSNHNTLINNTANSNTTQGFEVYISSNNTFTNNTANLNTKYGFKIDSGSSNTFTGNTANSNGDKGFYSVAGDGGGTTNSTFTNNTANLNTRHGFHLIGSNVGATLTGNTFNGNLQTGIKLQNVVTNLSMQNNNITNNPIGINIDSSVTDADSWTVSKNKITGNTTYGISNSGTGTLNAAENWWGTAVLTTIQSKVTGTVTVTPYYVTSDTSAGGTLSNVAVSTIHVDGTYTDGSAGGHTFGYDAFNTIKDGVAAVASGGTINVAAGDYHESQIVVWLNKGFTLQGAGAEVTTIDGDNAAAVAYLDTGVHPGTIYVKNPDTPILIDGFTFIDPVTTSGEITSIAIAFGSGAPTPPTVTISNNHFVGVANNGANPFDNAIYVYAAPTGVVTHIENNEFENQWQSIILEQTRGGAVITGNDFHDLVANSSDGGVTNRVPQGMHLMTYGGVNITAPITINTNTFSNFNGWPVLMSGGYTGSGMGKYTDVQIENNQMNVDGIGIVFRNPATTLGDAALGGVQGATISGNTIASITPGSGSGIWLRGANNNATITTNKISGYANGILSERYTVDVDAGISTGVNATANWWGDISGPLNATSNPNGTGNAVSNNVSFAPWYPALNGNGSFPVLDSDAPTSVLTDTPAALTNATSVNITVGGAGVVYYKYNLDGAGYNSETAVATPISESVSAGSHTVSVIGRDQSGNWQAETEGIVTTHTWTVDLGVPSAPTVTLLDPINNANKTGVTLHIVGESGTTYNYSIEDVTPGAPVTGTGTLTGGNQTVTGINVSGLDDGTLTASVTLTDAATNTGSAGTDTATKDIVAPSAVETTPVVALANDATPNVVITVETDASWQIKNENGGSVLNSGTGTGSAQTVAIASLVDETYNLTLIATDAAGNTTTLSLTEFEVDTTNPALVLGSLFTGQTLSGGLSYSINWTASDLNFSGTPIKLEYSIDGGSSWTTIIASTEDDGVYNWSVPTAINSSSAKIQITATDLASNDSSALSGTFTIVYVSDTTPPVVTLNSPNGAESWVGGSSHVITWTATDNVTAAGSLTVKLEYSTNGSGTWTTITSSTDNDGAYLWTVPNSASTNVLVKATVTDAATNVGSDLSNAVFTLTATPTHLCTDTGGGNWSCPVTLNTGWNLISLPVIVSNTAIATVLSGVTGVNTVQYWDTASNGWKYYIPGAGGNTLDTMQDGNGYWIFMNETHSDTLTVAGKKAPAAPDHAPTYSVASGWNLVGFKSTISQLASTYLANLSSLSYTLLNASNENKNSSNMDAGKGYWLWMSGAGSIVTSSETE